MTLFVFKPCPNWRYCSGGIVAIAESFETVREIVEEKCNNVFDRTDKCSEKCDEESNCFNKWILVEKFEVQDKKERVVLIEYNDS